MAVLGEGYTVKKGLSLPSITVVILKQDETSSEGETNFKESLGAGTN